MWWIVILIAVAIPWLHVLRERTLRKNSERELLLTRWKSAQQERRWWYQDHQTFFDFYHPEYQKLWEVEIGAEALYIFYEQRGLGRFTKHVHTSWSDYKMEKDHFDSKKT